MERGTYHGLRYEFVFRHNRRFHRHVSFETLLGLAAHYEPASYWDIVKQKPPKRSAPAIVSIACQPRVGRVAIDNKRGAALHVSPYEGFDRRGGIVGDRSEANAARTGIEIFRALASRVGPIDVAIDHLDGPNDEDFVSLATLEERIAFPKFGLIDLDDSFQGSRSGSTIDRRSFCVSNVQFGLGK